MYIFIYRHKIMYSIYIGVCRFSPISQMTDINIEVILYSPIFTKYT